MKPEVTVPHRWIDLEVGDQLIEKLPPRHVMGAYHRILADVDWQRDFRLEPQTAKDGAVHTVVTRTR